MLNRIAGVSVQFQRPFGDNQVGNCCCSRARIADRTRRSPGAQRRYRRGPATGRARRRPACAASPSRPQGGPRPTWRRGPPMRCTGHRPDVQEGTRAHPEADCGTSKRERNGDVVRPEPARGGCSQQFGRNARGMVISDPAQLETAGRPTVPNFSRAVVPANDRLFRLKWRADVTFHSVEKYDRQPILPLAGGMTAASAGRARQRPRRRSRPTAAAEPKRRHHKAQRSRLVKSAPKPASRRARGQAAVKPPPPADAGGQDAGPP